MKQNFFIKFYFYMSVVICLFVNHEYIYTQQIHFNHDEIDYHDIQAALTVLRTMHHEIEDLPENKPHADIIIEVIAIFIEMYRKIVEATVAYYLMPNTQTQHDLHDIIVKIIADDTIKLISFLSQRFIHFIFDHQISWQEKIGYCAWILSMICIIKIGIEKLPKNINSIEKMYDIKNKSIEKVA